MKPKPVLENSAVGMGSTLDAEGTALEVTRQMSVKIGLACLRTLATHLADALQADYVFVGEFTPNSVPQVTILAASVEDEAANLIFEMSGSVCSRIAATGKPVQCGKHARGRFPHDPVLSRWNAEACIAVPLKNLDGNPIGAIMAAYRAPVANFSAAKSILGILAQRAAAEVLHKQEKDRLRKSEERYQAFVSLNNDGMWCVEFDRPIPTNLPAEEQIDLAYRYGYCSECNDAAAKLLGRERTGDTVGRRIANVFPKPVIRKAFLDLIHSAYRFTTTETAHFLPDGKRHFVLRSQWGVVEEGMLQRIWGVSHDITDFKQVQHALDTTKQRMIDLLDGIHLLVVVLDPSAGIQVCNNYFTELTDWRLDDLKGKNWFDLLVPAEERAGLQEEFTAELARPGKPIHFESTLLGPGGRRWQVAWDSLPLRDEEGKLRIANIGRDITQEKAYEAHLRQVQKIESIGRLAGGIAHDFNNLLTVITGYTCHLLDRRAPGDPDYSELSEVRNAAEKGTRLTEQLLTFSRRRASRQEVLNLNAIVERDSSMLRRTLGKDIELLTILDPSVGTVRAQPVELSQVILNLAVNARDAMPHGGKLTIATSTTSLGSDQGSVIAGVPDGEYVQLTITDTGTGMSQEALDHLFEPFFTTKQPGKGTGLGMSIVYGIVKQSGGHIRVESTLGRGTSIVILLPRSSEPAAPSTEEPPQSGCRKSNFAKQR
jgi:PAS domain S-box-containing protein